MKLKIDTTTGKPFPLGEVLQLARGPAPATLQFLTDGVATLLAAGQPVALKLYDPADPETLLASFDEWTRNVADGLYTAVLNPTAVEALAWTKAPTLLAKVTYGDAPEINTPLFHVSYGGTAVASAPVIPIVITALTGPVEYVQEIGYFAGKVKTNQVEGFWRASNACEIRGLQLNIQDAPTGADLIVELTKNGDDTGKEAKITAAQKSEETLFDPPLSVAAGDVLKFRLTQVGSGTAGSNLAVKAKLRLTAGS